MYCHNCGHRNPPEANFCSVCGVTIQPQEADNTITLSAEATGESIDEFSLPVEELEGGKAVLVVKKGPEAGTRFSVDKDLIACGRHSESDIFLDDVTVSRKHAEIVRDDSGYKINDLGSLNGTFVNRTRVTSSPLNNSDEIQIGKFQLVFFTEQTA